MNVVSHGGIFKDLGHLRENGSCQEKTYQLRNLIKKFSVLIQFYYLFFTCALKK